MGHRTSCETLVDPTVGIHLQVFLLSDFIHNCMLGAYIRGVCVYQLVGHAGRHLVLSRKLLGSSSFALDALIINSGT